MQRRASGGVNLNTLGVSFFPFHRNSETSACTESRDLPLGPCLGERGQDMNLSPVGLQQHFGNCRCETEVAVEIQRGAIPQQGFVGEFCLNTTKTLPSLLAIQQAREHVCHPCLVPSREVGGLTQLFQKTGLRALCEGGIGIQGADVVARKNSEEMGQVSVPGIVYPVGFDPLADSTRVIEVGSRKFFQNPRPGYAFFSSIPKTTEASSRASKRLRRI